MTSCQVAAQKRQEVLPPRHEHEVEACFRVAARQVAAEPKSATGQYLKPLLERASTKPIIEDAAPKRPKRSRKIEADELIADKLAGPDWAEKLGQSDSSFVNAATFSLLLTGKVLEGAQDRSDNWKAALGRAVGRLGEPVVRD